MNRLLCTVSKSAASSLHNKNLGVSSAVRFLSARHFSDSASAADDDVEVKVGTVKNFIFNKQFGFIIPDGIDRLNHKDSDLIFIHRTDIKQMEFEDGERFFPGLLKGQRVQFKVGAPDEGKQSGRAYDLTLEGGDFVPPFQPGYLRKFIQKQKARLGDEVFEILSTVSDEGDLETKIAAAYNNATDGIEKQRAKIQRVSELMGTKYDDDEEKEETK